MPEQSLTEKDFNPTYQKVQDIFQEALEQIERGEKPNLYELQVKHGYSKASAKSYAVKKTKAWNELLETKIKDDPLLEKLNEIALNAEKDSDSIRAIDKLLQLKDRYPDKVSKSYSVQQKINSLRK